MSIPLTILAVAVGGAFGAASRFCVHLFCRHYIGGTFPLATFIVNVIGSLALGLFLGWMTRHTHETWIQPFVAVGFLGSFTTFSTYAYESSLLFTQGRFSTAFIYMALSHVLALLGAFGGFTVMRQWTA